MIRKVTILGFIVISLAAINMAGCAEFSPCCPTANVLLSQAEAGLISGLRMELAFDHRDSQGSSCAYIARTADRIYSVTLSLHRFDDGPSHEEAHRQHAAKYGKVENIAGVGDSAFLATLDNGELHIYARKGPAGFQLHADSISPQIEARGKLVEIARLVASRL